mmetsp:Transcript_57981/g.79027  ORF Transcript_57981/g.79027 Transcript_57981/m.79027 type:complete len:163 (-) Transcript_57981:111-599(-)
MLSLKMGGREDALKAVGEGRNALKLAPNHVKAMYLTGKAHLILGNSQEAKELLKQALALAPTDKAIRVALRDVGVMEKNERLKEKEVWRGKLKDSSASTSPAVTLIDSSKSKGLFGQLKSMASDMLAGLSPMTRQAVRIAMAASISYLITHTAKRFLVDSWR